jgi:uncharacterized membrane protein YgcG
MTVRRFLTVFAALVIVMLGAGPAAAEPPLEVFDRITDQAGVLAGNEPAVFESVERLATVGGVDLFVVFVSSFDAEDAAAWVDETAQLSALEGADMLLAVAVGEGTYAYEWWIDESFPLTETDVEQLVDSTVAPALDAGDWGGAVSTLAGELQSMAPGTEGAQTSSWTTSTTMLVVGGVAAAFLAGHLLSRRRTSPGRTP